MNRDLLEALGALASDFYFDALERHPGLLLDPLAEVTDEDLVIWRVLMVLDELFPPLRDALDFDAQVGLPAAQTVEEDLPF